MTVAINALGGKYEYDISAEEHFLLLNVGLAMLRFQHFEALLIAILSSFDKSTEKLTLDNIDTLFDKYKKHTFGQLNLLMQKKVRGEKLYSQLKNLKNFRNYLAHDCLKAYACMKDEEKIGLALVINEKIDLADEVQEFLIEELSVQNVTHISKVSLEVDNDGKIVTLETE